ncbi:sporulation protein YunB [Aquibacillus salsiterrae]|uniref:Sporulation protein YunB n=1 Tax=Aquibacillus salsiterrae TaxID=2950439 RepID=A0A9X4AFC9_9BACI|nr:sporulation protein YunB [Aquibacillus salsiterrae]MDC3417877.1 sporulation protein YunB [Aquibacillus salsiterrae]
MRKRVRIRKRMTPPPMKNIIVITMIFFFVFTFLGLIIVNKGIEPRLREIAEAKTNQFLTIAVNAAFSKKLNDELGDDLIKISYTNDGYVANASVNNKVVNEVLRGTTNRVENFLTSLENGTLPEAGETLDVELQEEVSNIETVRGDPTLIEIPLGQIFGLSVLENLGPKIPVSFHVIGNVRSEQVLSVEEPGINTKIMVLTIKLTVNLQIVLPFSSETTQLTQEVPVATELIEGDVPEFFNDSNGNGGNADFSIPIDPLQTP